jgi:hypothetical protein
VLPNHFPDDCSFHFPDGPLQPNKVYHVYACNETGNGAQGLYLTGLRVFLDHTEISWSSSRFRRVESTGHPKINQKTEPDSSNTNQDSDSALET